MLSAVLAREKDVKITVIKLAANSNAPAVLPSREAIEDGSYALARQLFFYWNGNSRNKLVPAFVDFCSTKGAQLQ